MTMQESHDSLSTLAEQVDKRYREHGWTREQLGNTSIYSRPLSKDVFDRMIEVHLRRMHSRLWWRLLHKLGIVA